MSDSAELLKGRPVAKQILTEVARRVEALKGKGVTPHLTVVSVGNDPSASSYFKAKSRIAKKVGAKLSLFTLEEQASTKKLVELIDELSRNPEVHGIMVYQPLPKHIDAYQVLSHLSPDKDVDGITPLNQGLLLRSPDLVRGRVPATPEAVIRLLKGYSVELEGRHVVIVGRSLAVGKPLAHMMLHENATVTVAHSKTVSLEEVSVRADILVVAVGRPKLIGPEHVKEGAVVVDVGINVVGEDIVGDVDFDALLSKVRAITPVPGGIGPITTALIFEHLVDLAERAGS